MYDKSLYDFMELEYSPLQEGDTISGELCPKCKGGMSKEKTLSVSRVNRQLLWMCHRASCDFRRGKKYDGTIPKDSIPKGPREINYPMTVDLTEPIYKLLEENYGISKVSSNRAGIKVTPPLFEGDCERLYLPIHTQSKAPYGYTAKAMIKGAKPKTINKTLYPYAMAWYPNTTQTKAVLVVEDQLSAIRASDFMTSIALLGTHLNEERIEAILSCNPTFIYLALDYDAWEKAVGYSVKFRTKADNKLIPVKITKDIKNMNSMEFGVFMEKILRRG